MINTVNRRWRPSPVSGKAARFRLILNVLTKSYSLAKTALEICANVYQRRRVKTTVGNEHWDVPGWRVFILWGDAVVPSKTLANPLPLVSEQLRLCGTLWLSQDHVRG